MKLYKYLMFLLFVTISVTNFLISAPIYDYPVELTQPDGSKIKCFLSGDEFYNYYHTKDGYFLNQGKDGFYYFVNQSNNSTYISNHRVDNSNPEELNLSKWLKPSAEVLSEIANFNDNHRIKSRKINEEFQNLKQGEMNNLVIFVRFADDNEYTDDISYYDSIYNHKTAISFKNFFLEASYKMLNVNTYFYPPSTDKIISVKDKNPRSFYIPYHETGNPNGYKEYGDRRSREKILITNALKSVLNFIPKNLDLDIDNDGYVDNFTVYVKGGATGWSNLLWPHRSWYDGDITINGSKLRDYNFGVTDLVFDNGYGLGTICHEFFHTLGSPDLYHYNQDGKMATGRWELMERTTNPPQFMCNFLKWQYTGWIENIPTIYNEGTYYLKPTTSQTGSIYKVELPESQTDFLILEYRKKEGPYDGMIPGSGLLVYKINTELLYQGNGNGPPDEIYLYRPDGDLQNEGSIAIANFCKEVKRTSIGQYTNPSLFFSDGSKGQLEIYDISDCGEEISFKISHSPRTNFVSPEQNSFDQILKPVFKWWKVKSAVSYTFQLAEDYDFNKILLTKEKTKDTTLEINFELKKETLYYARVKCIGSTGESPWSDVLEFTTIPDKTKLLYPENNLSGISVIPVFRWKQSINNNYYNVQVSDRADFNNIVFAKNFLKDTVISPVTGLKVNTKYYWRVKSISKTNYTTDSEVYTFNTKSNELIITDLTKSQDICRGDSIVLAVKVAGSDRTYQWYYNDELIENANNSTLTINDFSPANEGNYYCKLQANEDLILETNKIKLSEVNINSIEIDNFSVLSRDGDTANLFVRFDHKLQDFQNSYKLQWYKGDTLLFNTTKYLGVRSPLLRILNADSNDSYNSYKLQIISKCGDTVYTQSFNLLVSINENSANQKLVSLYPNPAKERVYVEFSDNLNLETVNIELVDLLGRRIFKSNTDLRNSHENNVLSIDLTKVNKGYYIILISDNKFKQSIPLFIE